MSNASRDAKWNRNNKKESNKKLTAYRISKFVLLFSIPLSIIFILGMKVALFYCVWFERQGHQNGKVMRTGGPILQREV